MKRGQKRRGRKGSRGSRGRPARPNAAEVHDAAGIAGMRAAGKLAAEILDRVAEMIGPGVSTAEIDALPTLGSLSSRCRISLSVRWICSPTRRVRENSFAIVIRPIRGVG